MKKIKAFLSGLLAAVFSYFLMLPAALAEGENNYAGIKTVTATDFAVKLKSLIVNVGTPVGASILVGSLIIVALKFMFSGGNDRKRAEALESLTSVAIGGVILGATLFLAGVILGIAESLQ